MNHRVHSLLLSVLLLTATQVCAENSFIVSPSAGAAKITNIDGYKNAAFLRLDGSYFPLPQFGVSVFASGYPGFEPSNSGTDISIRVNGFGAGVVGRWPLHPHAQPYIRLDYMLWNAEATALGRVLAKDQGGSTGLALGMQFPIISLFGIRAEISGYDNVSGANIRQISLAATFEF